MRNSLGTLSRAVCGSAALGFVTSAVLGGCDTNPQRAAECELDGGGCGLSAEAILQCTSLDAGIYGSVTTSCVGSGAPYPCGGCTMPNITVHGDSGVLGQPTEALGYYAIALPPGTYSVCCNLGNPNYPDAGADFSCTNITLGPNEVKRFDEIFTDSAGGDYCGMSP